MRHLLLLGALGALAACSDPGAEGQAQQQQAPKAPAVAKVAPPAAPAPAARQDIPAATGNDASVDGAPEPAASASGEPSQAALPPLAQAIDKAGPPAAAGQARPAGWSIPGLDPALIKAEVLLDRAGFSPGVIDGKDGQNLKQAVAAYAQAKGLGSTGLDEPVWDSLTSDGAPVMQAYAITDEDVAGPFIGDPPKDYEALAKLPALGFSSPLQALAEKFHADQKLLQALNPGVDWTKAGTTIVAPVPRAGPRALSVARIEVDKSSEAVRAYDASGQLTAYYPASVGSTERPAPSGTFEVVAVAPHPAYFYDPKRLTFTPKGAQGKLKIAPGPNNPVGETWIALSIPTYGIHGSPEPSTIGKHQSHGCVRLTNWDAVELGKAVKKGVKVEFVGAEKA